MSQLTIDHRTMGDVAIVDLHGKLTMGEGSVSLRETVRALLGEGHKKILVNLGDVGYVDSSGLGELVSASATAAKHDASLKLLHITERVHGLLQLTKLLTIFETFEDEAAAVGSFGPSAAVSAS